MSTWIRPIDGPIRRASMPSEHVRVFCSSFDLLCISILLLPAAHG